MSSTNLEFCSRENILNQYLLMLDLTGGPGVTGCTLLSHAGFVDHRQAIKEAHI